MFVDTLLSSFEFTRMDLAEKEAGVAEILLLFSQVYRPCFALCGKEHQSIHHLQKAERATRIAKIEYNKFKGMRRSGYITHEWEILFCPTNMRHYFHNSTTKEKVWNLPGQLSIDNTLRTRT